MLARPRRVIQRVEAQSAKEGKGAVIRRSLGSRQLPRLDPFLMLDEFTSEATGGVPDHPHRGFETVTYILKGSAYHEDFCGHKGTLEAGDLQWMTAGKGIDTSNITAPWI